MPAFTTNAVAERAGVSIGTLYQYFADKNAILLALARQQMTIGLASIGRALQGESDPSVEGASAPWCGRSSMPSTAASARARR